jgi:site-specific recombinase XerC
MANIAKRPNGQWRARYRDQRGKEHARHFDRKIDAQQWLDSVVTAVQTGAYVDPNRSRITVAAMAEQWFDGKVSLRPTTRALYASVLDNHVLPRWRDVPLAQVEHGAVQAWVAQLVAGGLSAGHVRKVHGVLSGILGLAVRDRRLPANPALGADLPRGAERRRRYLTATQVEQLAVVAGKNREDLVFTTPTGAPLRTRNSRRDWFDAAAAEIGEAGLTPHELRHTAASLAVSAGANVKAVQRMLGHASAALTLDRYADLFDDDLDAVADRLDAVARDARGHLADYLRTGSRNVHQLSGEETAVAQ